MTSWIVLACALCTGLPLLIHVGLWLPVADRRIRQLDVHGPAELTGINRRGALAVIGLILLVHAGWTLLVSQVLVPSPAALGWLVLGNVLLAPCLFAFVYDVWIHLHLFSMPRNRPWLTLSSSVSSQATLPTVTVVIPCRNEPLEVVRLTVESALDLDYPAEKLSLIVTDNSDDSHADFRQLAHYILLKQSEGAKIQLIHRSGTAGFKAGNLDEALKHLQSDLVLFLDVDNSIPTDLLIKHVEVFCKQPRLAFVQCYNLPCNRGVGRFASAASQLLEQHKFMEYVNSTLGWSFFQGHACLWRTSALQGISPLAQTWRGEDILTEDLCMTVRVIELGMYGRTEWSPAGYWAPTQLLDFERMIVRWLYGNWQVFLGSLGPLLVTRIPHLTIAGHVGLWRHLIFHKVLTFFPFIILLLPQQSAATLLLVSLWFVSGFFLPLLVAGVRPDANWIRNESKPRQLVNIHLLSLFSNWCQIRAFSELISPQVQLWVPTPKLGHQGVVKPNPLSMFNRPLAFSAVVVSVAVGYFELNHPAMAVVMALTPMLYQAIGVLLAILFFASSRHQGCGHDVERFTVSRAILGSVTQSKLSIFDELVRGRLDPCSQK